MIPQMWLSKTKYVSGRILHCLTLYFNFSTIDHLSIVDQPIYFRVHRCGFLWADIDPNY